MKARRSACLLVALLLLVSAVPASGQMLWDQDEYVDLVERGQRAYDEAMELPDAAVHRRHELLQQSLRAKAAARRLLYAGLMSAEFDDAYDAAMTEWFNLTENLVVTLTLLSQCDAAELAVDELDGVRDRLSADAVAYIDNLRERVANCREQEAAAEVTWDIDRYRQLLDDAEVWQARADQSRPGSDSQRSLQLESVWRREQAVNLLRVTLFTYAVAPGLEDPVGTLFQHYPLLIDGLVELGFCNAAQRRLAQRGVDERVLSADAQPPEADLQAHIDACLSAHNE